MNWTIGFQQSLEFTEEENDTYFKPIVVILTNSLISVSSSFHMHLPAPRFLCSCLSVACKDTSIHA